MIRSLQQLRQQGPVEQRLVDDLVHQLRGCGECASDVWIGMVERFVPAAPPEASYGEAISFAEGKAMYWIAVGLEAGSSFTRFRPGRPRAH